MALEGLSSIDKNELLFARGINFNDVPLWQKHGVGIYWDAVSRSGTRARAGRNHDPPADPDRQDAAARRCLRRARHATHRDVGAERSTSAALRSLSDPHQAHRRCGPGDVAPRRRPLARPSEAAKKRPCNAGPLSRLSSAHEETALGGARAVLMGNAYLGIRLAQEREKIEAGVHAEMLSSAALEDLSYFLRQERR